MSILEQQAEVVVIGAGPGGYTAAFRAADLGKQVTLIDSRDTLGGVCLNVGCIPSKALLHAAKLLSDWQLAETMGIKAQISVDLAQLRSWQQGINQRLTQGLAALAKRRKVKVITGKASFLGPKQLELVLPHGEIQKLQFQQAVIAVGSSPIMPGFIPADPRIMTSTEALALQEIPARFLIIGGGIIGLEMGTIYQALGAAVTVVELQTELLAGADADLVAPLHKHLATKFEHIYLGAKVQQITPAAHALIVEILLADGRVSQMEFDRILVATGRASNAKHLQLGKANLQLDAHGFLAVDQQLRTAVPHIYAIGDVVGNPMLAHKASAQAKIAAEALAGLPHFFEPRCIPNVAYTHPELAWVGLTEREAKLQQMDIGSKTFPWAASGRAMTMGATQGLSKLIFEASSGRLLGAGIVGEHAGELIAEAALALEMGCHYEDLALTIHPHPTLSETWALTAEMVAGTITDL
jgi:dihydrolipoamide dehydrogenase